ncbi:MAG: type II toxin-antitoxin system VapC family toxin [candidate division KSB1 bacterium]|nr:type II toxin-antitoxin system VapC family toxin [candidate division KSB1 bacterium]
MGVVNTAPDTFNISIVKAELIYGVWKSAKPKENLEKCNDFINHFISLPFDDRAAEDNEMIRYHLESKGKPIGPNDMLIAAIALSNHITLVTNNTREFCRVKDLNLKDWGI